VYHVSTSGSDSSGTGAISTPFATPAKALSLAQPGDTVYLRGGVYRSTITAVRSGTWNAPITISAFPGEAVTVTGLDVVSGPWTLHSSAAPSQVSIYSTPSLADIGLGQNQLFVNGAPVWEARLPNDQSGNLMAPTLAPTWVDQQFQANSTMFAELPDLSGALFRGSIGLKWNYQCAIVTAYDAAVGRLTLANVSNPWFPSQTFEYNQNSYDQGNALLFGHLALLDTAGEWVVQRGAGGAEPGTLYLGVAAGTSPSSLLVEQKTRALGFSTSNYHNLVVSNLTLLATAALIRASNVTLQHCTFSRSSHFLWFTAGASYQGQTRTVAAPRATAHVFLLCLVLYCDACARSQAVWAPAAARLP
jgi:hypothetical protein